MKITNCKSCKAKIVFLETKNKRLMPVNYDSLLPVDIRNLAENVPVLFDGARGHISHFATCSAASKFRKAK